MNKEILFVTTGANENIYQIIIAEGMAKRKNSPIPWKISIEIGTRVFLQAEEYVMYNPSKITFNQYEIPIATAAPRFSSPDLNTKIQHRGMWKHKTTQELISIGLTRLCVWKYLTSGWSVAYAKSAGISHIVNFPASCEIRGSWPMKLRNFPM